MKRMFPTFFIVKYYNRVPKVMLLVAFACCFSPGVSAQINISENAEINSDYTISGFVVYNKNLTINNATLTVTGKLIVEGDLIMNNSTLVVWSYGIISVKKHLKGTGGTLEFHSQNKNHYGTIAILMGIETGEFHVSKDGNKSGEISFTTAFYVDGETIDGHNLSNTASTAYANSEKIMKEAADLGLLPIELTSFTATATEYGYTFNWVTASEDNNDYFTLEYSINGVDFNEIDYVHGAGTTSQTSEYEYAWDAKPTADILYFRLKQTDYNGEFTYSDILVYAPKASHGATRTLYYGPLKLNVVDGQLRYIAE